MMTSRYAWFLGLAVLAMASSPALAAADYFLYIDDHRGKGKATKRIALLGLEWKQEGEAEEESAHHQGRTAAAPGGSEGDVERSHRKGGVFVAVGDLDGDGWPALPDLPAMASGFSLLFSRDSGAIEQLCNRALPGKLRLVYRGQELDIDNAAITGCDREAVAGLPAGGHDTAPFHPEVTRKTPRSSNSGSIRVHGYAGDPNLGVHDRGGSGAAPSGSTGGNESEASGGQTQDGQKSGNGMPNRISNFVSVAKHTQGPSVVERVGGQGAGTAVVRISLTGQLRDRKTGHVTLLK